MNQKDGIVQIPDFEKICKELKQLSETIYVLDTAMHKQLIVPATIDYGELILRYWAKAEGYIYLLRRHVQEKLITAITYKCYVEPHIKMLEQSYYIKGQPTFKSIVADFKLIEELRKLPNAEQYLNKSYGDSTARLSDQDIIESMSPIVDRVKVWAEGILKKQ